MIIEVKNQDTYVPVYGGNSKLPKDSQMVIEHRFLLPGERQKYIYTEDIVLDKMKNTIDSKVKWIQDLTGIAKAVITGIKNFEIKADGKAIKVDTVDKLYNTMGVPPGLITEIETAIFLASPEVDVDKLKKP